MRSKIIYSLLFLLILCFSIPVKAQIFNPVEWSFDTKKTGNNEYELLFTADIDAGWHLYSQHLPDGGPIPTSFHFNEDKAYQLIGKTEEPEAKTDFDPNFQMELSYFEGEVTFRQKVKVKQSSTITGELEFMVCDDEKCLPPELVEFNFAVKKENNDQQAEETKESNKDYKLKQASVLQTDGAVDDQQLEIYDPVKWTFETKKLKNDQYELIFTATIEDSWHVYAQQLPANKGLVPTSFQFESSDDYERIGETEGKSTLINSYDSAFSIKLDYYEKQARFSQKVKFNKRPVNVSGSVEFMVCNNTMCLPPETVDFVFELNEGKSDKANIAEIDGNSPGEDSFWNIFLIALVAGFAALITPCVFPMIPLTVSFFTKQSQSRMKGKANAVLYGFYIVLIYLILSIPFHLFESVNPDILNNISTNVYLNIFFFVIFMVFAFSFLGAFELTLPSSWVNKADNASNVGGLVGIFFMALTLVLVSFSCTGPVLGALLGATLESAQNEAATMLTFGMLGFGVGLALPFGLFAMFPGWLNSLPKSGGWLNTVKVTLGFLELALAFKFLSNADLVVQAGLLQREVFLAIWIAIFFALSLYLFGFFRMSHDSKTESLGVTRLLFAIVSFMFTMYLIPGLWGAPLKLISGFPPPSFYSESPKGLMTAAGVSSGQSNEIPEGSHPESCPHGLNCFHDYDKGMAYAKQVNKPVLIDFTGWACVNCRRMEEQVWSHSKILKTLREDVVLISLYVDEKIPLPESERKEVMIGNKKKKLRTVGDKWAYFEASRFGTNAQPYYVLLDHNGQELNQPVGYVPDIDLFLSFLREGVENFKNPESQSASR